MKTTKQEFYIEALWDEEAKVYYSKSDIPGLNIEANSLGEFEDYMQDLVPILLIENVLKPILEENILRKMNPNSKVKTPEIDIDFDTLPAVEFRVPPRQVNFVNA